MKKKNLYNLLFFLGVIIIDLWNFVNNHQFFSDMFAFELVYICCNLVFFLIPRYSFTLPCMVIRFTGLIRYVIYPIIVYKQDDSCFYFDYNIQSIMLLEIILTHIIIVCYYNSRLFKKIKFKKSINEENDYENKIIPMRMGVVTIAISVIGFLILARNPTLLINYFVFDFSGKSNVVIGGGSSIILQISMFFALLFVLTLIKKNRIFNNFIKVLLSFLCVLVYANGKGVSSENVSRWTIIISVITGIVFVISLYPKAKKMIAAWTVVLLPIVIIFSSTMKQEMWGRSESGLKDVISAESLNGYFSGSLNMNKGLALLDNNDFNRIQTICVDTFANFPVINHYVDISHSTATRFNLIYYGSSIARDQICPMIIQCREYFGFLGWLMYAIIVLLALHFNTVAESKNSLLEKNIFVILTFYFSLVFCLNWSILLEVLWIQVLPLLLVNKFNVRLVKEGGKCE